MQANYIWFSEDLSGGDLRTFIVVLQLCSPREGPSYRLVHRCRDSEASLYKSINTINTTKRVYYIPMKVEPCADVMCRRRHAGQFWSAAARHRSKKSLKVYISPLFWGIYYPILFEISLLISGNVPVFCILYVFFVPPSLTMMLLCITQCTYSTPLGEDRVTIRVQEATRYTILIPQKF